MNEYDEQYNEVDDRTVQAEWNTERLTRVKGQVKQGWQQSAAEQCITAVQAYWNRTLFSSARLPGMKKLPPFGIVKINTIPTIIPLHYEFVAFSLSKGKLVTVDGIRAHHEASMLSSGSALALVMDPLGDQPPLLSREPQYIDNRLIWSLPAGVNPFEESEFHISFCHAHPNREEWGLEAASGEAAFAQRIQADLRYLKAETENIMQLGLAYTGHTFEMFRGHLDQMLEGIRYEVIEENPDSGGIDLRINLQENQGNAVLINRVIHQFQTS